MNFSIVCAGVYQHRKLGVGVVLRAPVGVNKEFSKMMVSPKNWDSDIEIGKKAAEMEAVCYGISCAGTVFSGWKNGTKRTRIHAVFDSGSYVDLENCNELHIITGDRACLYQLQPHRDAFYNSLYAAPYRSNYKKIVDFFEKEHIKLVLDINRKDTAAARNLAMKELATDVEEFKYLYRCSVASNVNKWAVPLSIFRRDGWTDLTISEAIVVELIDNAKMTLTEAASELGRAYNTVRTQYLRGKKKIQV